MNINILELEPEKLKLVATILQQATALTNAHVKASASLAHFELETGNPERGIFIDEDHEKKTRNSLVESVELAAKNLKLVGGVL